MKMYTRILGSTVGVLIVSLSAASASTSPIRSHWQTVFRASAPYGLSGLAIDQRGPGPNKWMYTANARTGYLLRVGTGGHYLGRWSYGPRAANPYVLSTVGIAIGGQGNVFVTNATHNRIEKFYPPSGLIKHWGTPGSGPNEFNVPAGIAVDRQGNVYVADELNHRIQKFTPGGTFLSTWQMPWRNGHGYSMPMAIAIGPKDSVYVGGTCYRDSCPVGHLDRQDIVVKFSSTGRVLGEWVGGTPHGGVGPSEKPWIVLNAIAVDARGNWYVTGLVDFPKASIGSGVLQFSPAGKLLNQWHVPEASTLQGISTPRGIALDPRQGIYVTQGTQVLRLVRQ